MQIKQLNCTACGAPITVPVDVDHINCSSCGSFLMVQRGEGYVALKMVEKVAQAIQDSTFVTQAELKKLQLSQEISMLEMQLNSIRGEIRGMVRSASSSKSTQQIQELHFQEFTILERLRHLFLERAAVTIPNPEDDPNVLQLQLDHVEAGLVALRQSALYKPQVRQKISELENEKRRLTAKLLDIKVAAWKKKLGSYQLASDAPPMLESVKEELVAVEMDIKSLSSQPRSPETQALLSELKQRQATLIQQWMVLENERIVSALSSTSIGDTSSVDLATAQSLLSLIQNDIRMLEGWEQNSQVMTHLTQLRKKEKNVARQIKKLEKSRASLASSDAKKDAAVGLGCLSMLGLGALFASIWGAFTQLVSKLSQTGNGKTFEQSSAGTDLENTTDQPVAAESEDYVLTASNYYGSMSGSPEITSKTATLKALAPILKGCLVALIPLIGLSFIGFVVFGFFLSSQPDTQGTTGIGVVFTGIWIGYSLGAWKFFQVLRSPKVEANQKHRIWYAILGAIAAWVGTYLFFLSISGYMDTKSDASTNLLMTGFCVGPFVALILFSYLLKPEARIWKPVQKLISNSTGGF